MFDILSVENRKKLIVLAILAVAAIVIVPSLYFYFQYQETRKILRNPTQVAQLEVKTLTAEVAGLIDLPKGEEPTIATVSDKNKLKDQPFFKNSENGDKVLIFTKARKAILYRPSTNKIIEVAPINIGEGTRGADTGSTASPSPSPTILPFAPAPFVGQPTPTPSQ